MSIGQVAGGGGHGFALGGLVVEGTVIGGRLIGGTVTGGSVTGGFTMGGTVTGGRLIGGLTIGGRVMGDFGCFPLGLCFGLPQEPHPTIGLAEEIKSMKTMRRAENLEESMLVFFFSLC